MSNIFSYGAFAAAVLPRKKSGICCEISPTTTQLEKDASREKGVNGAENGKTSRRRRLWELPHKYHCPIIGVCFDVAELRKIVGRVLKYPADTTDYVWHTIAVGVCDTRCPMSEQFGRILDRRFAVMIRRLSACKTPEDLCQAWRSICLAGIEIPAGLWAACTHPACDGELELEIHSDIHMIQHQVGAGVRVDRKAMQHLRAENSRLCQALAETSKYHEQQRAESVDAMQALNQKNAALQAEVSAREASNQRLRAELDQLRSAMPDLPERQRLLARLQEVESMLQAAREHESNLEKEVCRLRDFAVSAEETIEILTSNAHSDEDGQETVPGRSLSGKSVLCVGGRSGAMNSYREVVEQFGGRFMHHDGGREESLHRIDSALAAADIVICQAGCISHNAYWRVKDQCKRTGKPCMFVKNAGLSSFERIIEQAGRQLDCIDEPIST